MTLRNASLIVLWCATFVGPAQAATGPICVIQCMADPACQVGSPGSPTGIAVRSVKRVEACDVASLISGGGLQGIVDSPNGPKRFVIPSSATGKRFKDLHAALFATSSCGSVNPDCAEAADRARVAGVGGKGIDAVAAKRSGSPCALGLPCGTILLPASTLEVELIAWPNDGSLRLRAVRGASGERSLPVVQGRFQLPPGLLAAGAGYAYALVSASGAEVAAGEFSVLSARMQADVESDLVAARPKNGDELSALDRVDVLLQNNLGWNASQIAR